MNLYIKSQSAWPKMDIKLYTIWGPAESHTLETTRVINNM